MSGSVKFAVSMPGKEYKEIEAFRKKRGMSRSKFILEAVQLWRESQEREKLVKAYEEGYRRHPENPRDTEAWEKSSRSIFSGDDW